MLTSTSAEIKRLEDKISTLEEEIVKKDRALAAQKKLIDELEVRVRKWKSYYGIERRHNEIMNDPEVREL